MSGRRQERGVDMSTQTQSKVVEALLDESRQQSSWADADDYSDHSDHSDAGHSDNWNDGSDHSDAWSDAGDY